MPDDAKFCDQCGTALKGTYGGVSLSVVGSTTPAATRKRAAIYIAASLIVVPLIAAGVVLVSPASGEKPVSAPSPEKATRLAEAPKAQTPPSPAGSEPVSINKAFSGSKASVPFTSALQGESQITLLVDGKKEFFAFPSTREIAQNRIFSTKTVDKVANESAIFQMLVSTTIDFFYHFRPTSDGKPLCVVKVPRERAAGTDVLALCLSGKAANALATLDFGSSGDSWVIAMRRLLRTEATIHSVHGTNAPLQFKQAQSSAFLQHLDSLHMESSAVYLVNELLREGQRQAQRAAASRTGSFKPIAGSYPVRDRRTLTYHASCDEGGGAWVIAEDGKGYVCWHSTGFSGAGGACEPISVEGGLTKGCRGQ